MKYPLLSSRIYGVPLLIHPQKAAVIESVLRSHSCEDGAAIEGIAGLKSLESDRLRRAEAWSGSGFMSKGDKPYLMTASGIAAIPIVGTLVHRADWLASASGMTSYNRIQSLLNVAMTDRDVKGILLDIDSPGGEVSGCFDLADAISAMATAKTIWAIADEMAFSAAYALGSAAKKLYVPRTGSVGSIGVIMLHVDQSKSDAQKGLTYTYMHAGEKKKDGNPHEPLSSRARLEAQEEIDRLYKMFVASVAQKRGLSETVVRSTEAGLLSSEFAVSEGFADGIANLAEVCKMFEQSLATNHSTFPGLPGPRSGGVLSAKLETLDIPPVMQVGQVQPEDDELDAIARFAAGYRGTETRTEFVAKQMGVPVEKTAARHLTEDDELDAMARFAAGVSN